MGSGPEHTDNTNYTQKHNKVKETQKDDKERDGKERSQEEA